MDRDPKPSPTAVRRQCTGTVLMVRPTSFYSNPETQPTNSFQNALAAAPIDTLAAAQREFDGAAEALSVAGIEVAVADADPAAETPDALYPNNWFSTHADGSVVLYPMSTPNRRRERRPELLLALAERHGWRISRVADLAPLELEDLIVEGTGSLVLDREARIAYAALSPRTTNQAVEIACRELGYGAVAFRALDPAGSAIYHTNVMMSVGPTLAVLASTLVQPGPDLRRVFDALEHTGKTLLDISAVQVAEFAGNVLFLEAAGGPRLALSRRAWKSFTRAQRQLIEQHAQPVLCAVETIEHVGGGGIRCMLAEIFLPKLPATAG
jgi:hypothetical protein